MSLTREIFAGNVGRLRKIHGLTQPQVARFVGVSPGMISRYENPKNFSMPPAEVIDKLAEIFQVHISDLFLSEAAKLKRAELQGVGSEDVLIMINRTLAASGVMMVPVRKKQEKAS